MTAAAILRSTCDRCGVVHEQDYTQNVANHCPEGWERWTTGSVGALLFCPGCVEEVHELLSQPWNHVGWVSASGSGLSFTGLASTAKRDGYQTRVYSLGPVLRRVREAPDA